MGPLRGGFPTKVLRPTPKDESQPGSRSAGQVNVQAERERQPEAERGDE